MVDIAGGADIVPEPEDIVLEAGIDPGVEVVADIAAMADIVAEADIAGAADTVADPEPNWELLHLPQQKSLPLYLKQFFFSSFVQLLGASYLVWKTPPNDRTHALRSRLRQREAAWIKAGLMSCITCLAVHTYTA